MTAQDSVGRDPTSALELLWGTGKKPTRGPKPGVTVDRIVRAAIELADAEGVNGLSMRRVAGALGIGTASLYTYVPGKPELLALMLDAVIGQGSLPHTLPGGWRERLEAGAREDWAGFRVHPWVLQIASARPVAGPNLLRWYDSALLALAETGLSERDMVAVVESVDGYVRGQARAVADAAEAERQTGIGNQDWEAAQDSYLDSHVDFGSYPMVARVALAGGFPDADAVFEFGLHRILDGVESYIRRRHQ